MLLLHGPNLDLLGDREPEVYGTATLADHVSTAERVGAEHGLVVEALQSNHEGELVDAIHGARRRCAAIIINPGAFTHTSVAIRDAIEGASLPVIECHISNVHAREEFRHHSYVSGIAAAVVAGAGSHGYTFAVDHLARLLD